MLVIDRCIAQRNAETAQRAFSGLQNIRGRYHQWMNELPERVSHKTQHLDEKKSSVI
ncbi:cellulose synthase catalytic subunit domain protein [Shigella flexneri VA-6]|nr:cellulose synthase catalytic subunit domain protein [Shigella flexneri VA-6]